VKATSPTCGMTFYECAFATHVCWTWADVLLKVVWRMAAVCRQPGWVLTFTPLTCMDGPALTFANRAGTVYGEVPSKSGRRRLICLRWSIIVQTYVCRW
jgi:hypothetical protein